MEVKDSLNNLSQKMERRSEKYNKKWETKLKGKVHEAIATALRNVPTLKDVFDVKGRHQSIHELLKLYDVICIDYSQVFSIDAQRQKVQLYNGKILDEIIDASKYFNVAVFVEETPQTIYDMPDSEVKPKIIQTMLSLQVSNRGRKNMMLIFATQREEMLPRLIQNTYDYKVQFERMDKEGNRWWKFGDAMYWRSKRGFVQYFKVPDMIFYEPI